MPAFVVLPFIDFEREHPKEAALIASHKTPWVPNTGIPHAVVGLTIKQDMTLLRAWREYLGLTQAEFADKAGITQSALSQMESGESKLRRAARIKLATAMGLIAEQLA